MAERLRIALTGAVQGVGFRPFVYRLARRLELRGWCRNSPHGVLIEVEGERHVLEAFRTALESERPPRAAIHGLEASWLDAVGLAPFAIHSSETGGTPDAVVMADIATCAECRDDLLDPGNRRYRYPFTTCANCGPRFSIIDALPYDRRHTSMGGFAMCEDCRREYQDPLDRRFHAEPIACPACGPQVALWDEAGHTIAERDAAIAAAARAIHAGRIVALKGLGGFQLLVDATNDFAVRRLRARKHREEKPFAIMCADLGAATGVRLSALETRLLDAPEAPIVLVNRRDGVEWVAPSVAPGMRTLGLMLPYTPLHLLLLRDVGRPVVATSGNRAEEPMCIDEREAVSALNGIADLLLVHDRPIVRHVDDSVVRVMAGRELMLRRARGYAPLPLPLRSEVPAVVGVGAHLKNTVSLTAGAGIVVSQHIGDLDTAGSVTAFHEALADLQRLYRRSPVAVVVDPHPDYAATMFGRRLGLPVTEVQHHYAHLASCMADNDLAGRAVGAVWDGTGYGEDGTIWGGEFLCADDEGFTRVACLRPFRLPGGERAVREPRRSAFGALSAAGDGLLERWLESRPEVFSAAERRLLAPATARGVNAPVTTSVGRLIDAVSGIIGLRTTNAFEGQAAMLLEQAVDASVEDAYPFGLGPAKPSWRLGTWNPPALVIDWAPILDALLTDVEAGVAVGVMAARVHHALAAAIVAVAWALDERRMLLTGGCFQNRCLTEAAVARLIAAGIRPYWHQRLPPNDGAVSAGQVVAWLRANAALGRATDSPFRAASGRAAVPA